MAKTKTFEKENRTALISVRLTLGEKKKLFDIANSLGISLTSFVRQKLLYESNSLIQQVLENYKNQGL